MSVSVSMQITNSATKKGYIAFKLLLLSAPVQLFTFILVIDKVAGTLRASPNYD